MTLNDLTKILKDNYTCEELIDALNIEPHELVDAFTDTVDELFDELVERVNEELGYEDGYS